MRILVIDDDQSIRKLLNFNLSASNHEVISAVDGLDGIKKAIALKPDLILLDIMMPIMDGFETCRKLKSDGNTKNIPIFILSAKSQMTDLDEAFDAGADDYIIKPFDIDKLEYTLNFKLKIYNERKKKK